MTDWAAVEAARVGAERKVAELQIRSLPVDPIQVARVAGIHVEGAELEGASGCLMRQGDQFGILYSTSLPNAGFINFTVGHELGHYRLRPALRVRDHERRRVRWHVHDHLAVLIDDARGRLRGSEKDAETGWLYWSAADFIYPDLLRRGMPGALASLEACVRDMASKSP